MCSYQVPTVPREKVGTEHTSPLYTPFVPPGMFVATVGGPVMEGVIAGDGRENSRVLEDFGSQDVVERDGGNAQMGAGSEDAMVSAMILCLCVCVCVCVCVSMGDCCHCALPEVEYLHHKVTSFN